MPRTLTPEMLAALQAPILNPAIFVEASFASTTVRMWSGIGTVSWNGHNWLGLGSFLGFTTPEDAAVVEAKGITLTLSGLDPNLLPAALNDFQLGLPVTVYLALYSTTSPGTLIGSPVVAWSGRMDQPTISVSGSECFININCETRLLDMNVAVDRRYTNQDCQMTYPGDLGFSFVDSIQEMTVFFGFPNNGNNL